MKATPYLHFDGNCEEALKFYERCFGAKITRLLRFSEAPPGMPVTSESRNLVMHGRITLDDETIMASDAPGGRYHKPQGFSLTLSVDTPKDAERIFGELSERGTVQMAMSETFFAHRYGMLVDHFGIPWMVICEKTP